MKKNLILLILLMILTGCTESQPTRYSDTIINVGFNNAPVTLLAYTKDESEFKRYLDELRSDLSILGVLYDRYTANDQYPNINAINAKAGFEAVEVDPAVIRLIELSNEWTLKTNGLFDISLGPVLEIWHHYREEGKYLNSEDPKEYGRVPSLEALEAAKNCSGLDKIVISGNTVYLNEACASIDVGGIAKGVAADIAKDKLVEIGLENAIINLGHSTIITLGQKPNDEAWGIGIDKPEATVLYTDSSIDTLYLKGLNYISTSGDYQNFYEAEDGKIYHHLMDPNTLFPAESNVRSVTVVTDISAGAAEALSKALYILPYEEAMQLIEYLRTEEKASIEALWIYDIDQAPDAPFTYESEGYILVMTDGLAGSTRISQK